MFGENLKHIRENAGLSQKALADKIFVSQQTVAKWETNKTTPNPETIILITKVFGITSDYLLGISSHKTDEDQTHSNISSSENDFIKSYRRLDEGDKGEIRGIIKQMLRAPKYDFTKEATG